ncbi:MAG: PD-(D/E)XK nuclease-like domain-containing protein [Thermoguttaceae bacterium]|nr:PD-(D/E)XK nuclease-like domain-containing protein [Thermoguttaceae bacterium]
MVKQNDLLKNFIVEPAEVYHAKRDDYLTSHELLTFAESPRLFYRRRVGLAPKPSGAAFEFGSAAHTLVLEGEDAFKRLYVSDAGAPVNPKTGEKFGATTKTYKEWVASVGPKTVLSESQIELCWTLRRSVFENVDASRLLAAGRPELVFRGEYCGVDCQIRCDWLRDDGVLIDFKTCDQLKFFERDARIYGYSRQLAFYRALVEIATGQRFNVYIIATEKREPYATCVYRLAGLDAAQEANERDIERLPECWEAKVFPTGYEGERILQYGESFA